MTRSPAHPDAATTAWPLSWPFAAEDEPTSQPEPAAIDAWWPEGDGLASALGAALTPGAVDPTADAALQRVLSSLGAPLCGLATTPMSSRVGWLGAAAGVRYAHHELRQVPPLPDDARPDPAVWGEGAASPGWVDGVLEAPKYFSFFLEEPMAPLNPNHRIQWRAHELLHRLVGFGWHPGITPFEAYVCARLAELLPVVHWYHLDELGRRHCPAHRGAQLYDRHCEACEAAVSQPWWRAPEAPDVEALGAGLRRARGHFDEEMRACLCELEHGRRVVVPRPRLDAASDAEGYLRGHWPRVTAWSFGAWVELFLRPDVDVQTSASALARRVCAVASAVLGGAAVHDPVKAEARRLRRTLQDLGYRALMWLEAANSEADEDALLPTIEALGEQARAPTIDVALADAHVEALAGLVNGAWGEAAVGRLFCLGYALPTGLAQAGARVAHPRRGAEIAALREGLESGLTTWSERVPQAGREGAVETLRDAAALWEQGELRTRAATAGVLDEAGALEAWLLRRPHRDDEAELFAVLPEDVHELVAQARDGARLRAVHTLRRREASGAAVAALLDWPVAGRERVSLVALWRGGEPRLSEASVELDALLDDVLARAGAGETLDAAWLEALEPATAALVLSALEAGVMVWFPAPPGG